MKLWIYFMWLVAKCFQFVMSDMEQNRKTQLNYQEYAVRTGNHLYSGTCATAGHGVFTISCPEAVGKTLQFNLYLKHCNSQKKQNTSISVVIVPFRRVNKNSVAQDGLAQIYWVGWLNFRETIRLPDAEYLRFCVRKLLIWLKKHNTSISVVIVLLRRVNKNSVAQDGLAQIFE